MLKNKERLGQNFRRITPRDFNAPRFDTNFEGPNFDAAPQFMVPQPDFFQPPRPVAPSAIAPQVLPFTPPPVQFPTFVEPMNANFNPGDNLITNPISNDRPNIRVAIEGNDSFNAAVKAATDARVKELLQTTTNVSAFTKFNLVEDILSAQIENVTAGIWSDNISSLTTHFTSSINTVGQRRYYTDIYQELPSNEGAAIQYSIAYGHALGSGSDSVGQLNDSPSRAVYSQYRRMLLNPNDTRFTTAGSGSTDHIYIINFSRNRLKERLDPGNFELPLCSITSRATNATGSVVTGSKVITLIDDSSQAPVSVGEGGRVYNIVSGTIAYGVHNPTAPDYYGLVYPDHGVLVLDAKMLDQQLNFQTNTGSSVEGNNHFTLFHSISGSCTKLNVTNGDVYGFLARNSEKITSSHYFVRVKNGQYNFSNNPTYVTGSVGEFAQSSFITDPVTYITTIGLYDDDQQLLAVAKLSKPLLKSFTREALIRVKLDY